MEGRVVWYKPHAGRGCVLSRTGAWLPFRTPGEDETIHGGARVVFKVAEHDGCSVGVDVEVVQSCLEALVHEQSELARTFHRIVPIQSTS